jgi:hypothetical protein
MAKAKEQTSRDWQNKEQQRVRLINQASEEVHVLL